MRPAIGFFVSAVGLPLFLVIYSHLTSCICILPATISCRSRRLRWVHTRSDRGTSPVEYRGQRQQLHAEDKAWLLIGPGTVTTGYPATVTMKMIAR